MGYLCTYARADRASVSHKRLGRLCSNLVCGFRVRLPKSFPQVMGWVSLHVRTCRPRFYRYLRNGLTDCVQIWYVGWRSLSTWFPQVMSGVGHLCTSARAPPSPYLRIQVANCAKIWCMARRSNSYEIYKSRRWGDCTFARASPVSLSRKPLSPDNEATPKTDISFALARSSPNMASYWFIYFLH